MFLSKVFVLRNVLNNNNMINHLELMLFPKKKKTNLFSSNAKLTEEAIQIFLLDMV